MANTSADTSTEDEFLTILDKVFNINSIAAMSSKDAVFKETRDCVIADDENRYKRLFKYIRSYGKDLHFIYGHLCIGDKTAIPNARKYELFHMSHPGCMSMNDLSGTA